MASSSTPWIRLNADKHLELNPALEFLRLANIGAAIPPGPGEYDLKIDAAQNALVLVNPDTGDETIIAELPGGGGPTPPLPEDGSNFYAGSLITPANVASVAQVYAAPIGPHFNEEADNWVGITADANNIYLTTHARRWPTTGATGPPFTEGSGLVACFERETGQPVWRRTLESYSGLPDDYSRARPFLYTAPNGVKYLYFGSSIQNSQVTDLPSGPANFYGAFDGALSTPTGRRIRAYCVRADDGDLVWETELGEVATAYGQEDNMASITMPPIVVEVDRHNNGILSPVAVFGTSSTQSFFPFQQTTVPTTAFAPGFPGFVGNRNFRMTDQGKVFLLDALDGEVLSTTRMGPPPYKAGDVLNNALPVSQGGGYRVGATAKVFRDIQAGDIAAGQLNPVGAAYAGAQHMSWLLTNAFGTGGNVVPACLNGISLLDRTGAAVVLVGGAVITDNLEGAVIGVDITGGLVLGGVTFTPAGSVGGPFPLNAANLRPPGLEPARCWKYMSDGMVLDAADAYELSYHGCSVWGGVKPVINRDSQGRAVELYVSTGQNHHVPLSYTEGRLGVAGPLPPAVVDGTPFPAGPQPTSHILARNYAKTAEQNFLAFPTAQNLANIRQIDKDWLTTIQTQQAVALGARAALNSPCAFVGIDLRGANLGNMLWTQSSVGFDCWHAGTLIGSLRSTSDALPAVPANAPGQPFQFVSLYTDAQEYYGFVQATDGDFGSGCALRKGLGPGGLDLLTGFSKSANLFGITLSDVSAGPSVPARVPYASGVDGLVVAGTSAYLGGVNYGVGAKGTTLYGVQSNFQGGGFSNLPWQTGPQGSLNPSAQIFTPKVGWFPVTLTTPANPLEWQLGQSYLAAYNAATGVPVFEALIEPERAPPYIASTTTVSVTDTLVWCPDSLNNMRAFDAATGANLKILPLDAAGITSPALFGGELFVFSGRSFIRNSYAGSMYARTKFLYKFALPVV